MRVGYCIAAAAAGSASLSRSLTLSLSHFLAHSRRRSLQTDDDKEARTAVPRGVLQTLRALLAVREARSCSRPVVRPPVQVARTGYQLEPTTSTRRAASSRGCARSVPSEGGRLGGWAAERGGDSSSSGPLILQSPPDSSGSFDLAKSQSAAIADPPAGRVHSFMQRQRCARPAAKFVCRRISRA